MASCSFARDQVTRRLRTAAAATATALAAVATTPLLSSGTPTALIGTGSSCPGAMWLSTATGSRSHSESDEEDLPVGDEVCKRGYLRKQKHGHRRYFVLKLETADAPARLEYYENARKFRHSVRAAAAAAAAAASGTAAPALIPPRRVITLYQCFSVSQRADARYRHLIALFTQDEYFAMVAENESEQESWYLLLSRLILESKRRRCGTPCAQLEGEPASLGAVAAAEPPFYKDVWQVIVKPRGLGHRKELSGVFRLCLTDEEVVFVRLNTEVASVVVQLLSIRRCGHSEQYFFLEVGRSTVIGPGELWMQVDDCVVAQNMHELFLKKMRALCADEYRARCRSYSISIGAHLLTLLSTRRHLDMLPLEPGGWLRRSRFEQFCHLKAIGDGEDEMLLTRHSVPPREPLPHSRRGRLHLSRERRSRRAISVPASFFRRLAPSPVHAQQPAETPSNRACGFSEASSSGSGNSAEGNCQGQEGQEGSPGDYMPMNNWGSGNGWGSGGGQGSSGQGSSSQSSGGNQCSGTGKGFRGGHGSSGGQGSSSQGSGAEGAGGHQCSGDGQGPAGGHGSGSGQGASGGHGSGSGQGPGDGHSSGGGKNSGGSKGSGSGKDSDRNGERAKSLKRRSYFGKLIQSKQQQLPPPPPPPPPPAPAGATGGKGKSGGRFRLYFCADRAATKERKEAKEVKDAETLEGAAWGPQRAFDEDEDDPYMPMRPGVAAPLESSSDYMPMAPQNVSASIKCHSRSPFEDSRGYMMMFPRVTPPPAPVPPKASDPDKKDDCKDNDSDSDYMFMAPGAGAIPKPPQNPQGGSSSKSWSSYFSLPNPFRSYPLGQSDHSEYVPMLSGKLLGKGLDKEAVSIRGPKYSASTPSVEGFEAALQSFSKPGDEDSPSKPLDDGSPKDKAKRPNRHFFITKGNKIEAKPQKSTHEQKEADSSSDYINFDFTKRSSNTPAPFIQGLPHLSGIIANPRQSPFSHYMNIEFRVPFRNAANIISNILRAIPGANRFFLDGARWPLLPLLTCATGSNAHEEGCEYIEVMFNPAMTPALSFGDRAIRYDAETGRIYVVDPFSECCMDTSLYPSHCSEPPPVARLLQEEELERRRPQSFSQSIFESARAAVSAFPTDSLERDLSASLGSAAAVVPAPTLPMGPALAAASTLPATPGMGAAALGFEAAPGFNSASVRWFQPVANAAGAEAVRGARVDAGGSNPRSRNPSADLAGDENGANRAAFAAAAPPLPPRHWLPRLPAREDSDEDDPYVRMDFARPEDKKFDSPPKE